MYYCASEETGILRAIVSEPIAPLQKLNKISLFMLNVTSVLQYEETFVSFFVSFAGNNHGSWVEITIFRNERAEGIYSASDKKSGLGKTMAETFFDHEYNPLGISVGSFPRSMLSGLQLPSKNFMIWIEIDSQNLVQLVVELNTIFKIFNFSRL